MSMDELQKSEKRQTQAFLRAISEEIAKLQVAHAAEVARLQERVRGLEEALRGMVEEMELRQLHGDAWFRNEPLRVANAALAQPQQKEGKP